MGWRMLVRDPAVARFAGGGRADAEALLGAPLPLLPPPAHEGGQIVFAVRFPLHFAPLVQRYVGSLLADAAAAGAPRTREAAAEYEAALERILAATWAADRRNGLVNLFWLAHSLLVATTLKDLETRQPGVRRQKHALHPLLSAVHRRADLAARRCFEQADPARARLLGGASAPDAVSEAVIDDGLSFFECSAVDLDLPAFLNGTRRYRLTADIFYEVVGVLTGEIERRQREGDKGLATRLARHLPGVPKEQLATPAGLLKVALNPHVQAYLLADPWTTGNRLTTQPRLRAEAERRRPAEILDAFLEVCAVLRRFDLLDHVRSHVRLLDGADPRVSQGRVYEFSESARVLNNAVDATVLFLDLRGFTQTSEGQISARDLTGQLYDVFDAFVPHILRFGGTIDKFLGDGIMVTYGIDEPDPLGPLNALRSAILCQGEIIRLRRQGRTEFKMGVSVHYGRVYVARFMASDDAVQVTVIGRNVNLAGRLSSAAKKPMDEDDGLALPGVVASSVRDLTVTVDGGTLFNEGIVLSQDAVRCLEDGVDLRRAPVGDRDILEYFDEAIERRILIRYAGDARFKGVRASFPVYEVDFVR